MNFRSNLMVIAATLVAVNSAFAQQGIELGAGTYTYTSNPNNPDSTVTFDIISAGGVTSLYYVDGSWTHLWAYYNEGLGAYCLVESPIPDQNLCIRFLPNGTFFQFIISSAGEKRVSQGTYQKS